MRTPLLVSWLLAIAILAAAPGVLGQTQPGAPSQAQNINTYIEQLKDANETVRLQAAEAIGSMGPAGKPAVPALIEMLNSTVSIDRMAAAMALAKIGSDAAPALPALRAAQSNGDENVKKVASAAIETIDPPLLTTLMGFVRSPYVLAGILSIGGGAIALFVLVWRGRGAGKIPEPVWKENQAKAQQAKASAVVAPEPKPVVELAPTPTPAPAIPKHRARVSKPLPGLGQYVKETEGPETIKRDLVRAQEELKKVSDLQREMTELLEREDVASDTEQSRKLRKEIDEYAIEHYRAEIRVKALEIKMIEALLGGGTTATAELRERSEATLKQKWDEIRTLCETPSKIVLKADQWAVVAVAPTATIANLRARLRDFDVVVPDRSAPKLDSETDAPQSSPEESAPA
jgi:hypothetical protein